MHRGLTALAIMFLAFSCKERSSVDTSPKSVELPTMTIHAESDEKSMLIATVSNPSSSEISIPGFEGETIYGSYWYQGEKVVNAPECGTGFWNFVIKIPAGQTRKLRLPLPHAVTRGDRYTVAVVYGGLGSSLSAEDQKKVSAEQWIRYPDVSLNCRKMEAEVNLASK